MDDGIIDLSDQQLESMPDIDEAKADVALSVVLSGNSLVHLTEDDLPFPMVRTLTVSYNALQTVSFPALQHLSLLDLSHNSLTAIPDLRRLTSLTSLNLAHNMITALDLAHVPRERLQVLRLNDNYIPSITALTAFSADALGELLPIQQLTVQCDLLDAVARDSGVDYRPLLFYLLPTLTVLDDDELTGDEVEVAATLFSQANPLSSMVHLMDGASESVTLVQYLASVTPTRGGTGIVPAAQAFSPRKQLARSPHPTLAGAPTRRPGIPNEMRQELAARDQDDEWRRYGEQQASPPVVSPKLARSPVGRGGWDYPAEVEASAGVQVSPRREPTPKRPPPSPTPAHAPAPASGQLEAVVRQVGLLVGEVTYLRGRVRSLTGVGRAWARAERAGRHRAALTIQCWWRSVLACRARDALVDPTRRVHHPVHRVTVEAMEASGRVGSPPAPRPDAGWDIPVDDLMGMVADVQAIVAGVYGRERDRAALTIQRWWRMARVARLARHARHSLRTRRMAAQAELLARTSAARVLQRAWRDRARARLTVMVDIAQAQAQGAAQEASELRAEMRVMMARVLELEHTVFGVGPVETGEHSDALDMADRVLADVN